MVKLSTETDMALEKALQQRDELAAALRPALNFIRHHSNRWDCDSPALHPQIIMTDGEKALTKLDADPSDNRAEEE